MRISKYLILFPVFFLSAGVGFSQNNTSTNTLSPYSRYGYGQLADNSIGMSRGMGGIGYGLRTPRQVNPMNPASYTAIDSLTFLFDIGFFGQNSWFREGADRGTNLNGGVEYVVLQFPVGRYVGVSAGVLPFSYVGYDFGNTNDGITKTYTGSGGVSQAYLGVGVKPFKNLSVGANFQYMFGSISYMQNMAQSLSSYVLNTEYETKIHLNNFRFEVGAQYDIPLSTRETLTLGAVFSPGLNFHGNELATSVTYLSSSGTSYTTDTLSHQPRLKGYALPYTFGVGFTYNRDNKLTVGADFLFQNWSDAKYAGRTDTLSNRFKVSVGAEYVPDPRGRYLSRIRYRAGGFYNKSYLKVGSGSPDEFGIGVGLGLPVFERNNKSTINFSIDYVRQNPPVSAFVKEDYLRLSLSLSINEFWFFKARLK